MGSIFTNYAVNSFLRTVVTIVAQALATKLALDATQTADLTTWLLAGATQIIAFAPVLYNQLTRPSNPAMKVAEEADKVIAGEKKEAVVKTPTGVPNIVVKPEPHTRGGQG